MRGMADGGGSGAGVGTTARQSDGGRLVALDVTRTMAILGMIAVHVGGPHVDLPSGPWRVLSLAAGFAAGTFAVVAGVSLSLMNPPTSAGDATRPGRTLHEGPAWLPTLLRGVLLFGVGLLVEPLSGAVLVILCVYGVLFVVAPVLRGLPPAGLIVLGSVLAVGWPVVSLAARRHWAERLGPPPLELTWGVLTGPDGGRTAARILLLDGAYPVPTWLALALIAWGAHRCGLLSRGVAGLPRLAALSSGLIALGFGGAALVEAVWHPRAQAIATAVATGYDPQEAARLVDHAYGVPYAAEWPLLLIAGHHTGTPFELVQILAVAPTCHTLAAVLGAAGRPGSAVAGVLAWPGRIALTVYVGHLAALWWTDWSWLAGGSLQQTSGPAVRALAVFWIVAFAVGGLFRHRRGPLEWALHRLTHPHNLLMLRR